MRGLPRRPTLHPESLQHGPADTPVEPQSEECILDLGAAPGSKTLQLAELMGNQGSIWAVESVRGRFFRLRDNLARHGAENVQTHLADGTRIWRRHPERFDRVLLDAPCSSEGTVPH